MHNLKKSAKIIIKGIIIPYVVGAVIVFDFFSAAVPFDEETHNGKQVAIGPRPRSCIPGVSSDFDVPGGFGYKTDNWPFIVWRPVCELYLAITGYEKPIKWR